MTSKRLTRLDIVLVGLLFGAAWGLRAVSTEAFVTWDEPAWVYRSVKFLVALSRGDLSGTLLVGHPGVITMWSGALSLLWHHLVHGAPTWSELLAIDALPALDVHDAGTIRQLTALLPFAKGGILLSHATILAAAYGLLRELLDRRTAVAAAAMLILDPYYLGLSRVLHIDALTAGLMLLSLLGLLVYQSRGGLRWLVLSGILGGLAVLTKTYALGLGPVAGLTLGCGPLFSRRLLQREDARRPSGARWQTHLREMLIWALALGVTCVMLWPATWTAPLEVLRTVMGLGFEYATTPGDATASFFRGEITSQVGPSFYPIAMLFRITPLSLVGTALGLVIILASRSGRPMPRNRRTTMLVLIGYAFFFVVMLTVARKKFDRYALPALLALDVAGAVGLAAIVDLAWARIVRQRALGRLAFVRHWTPTFAVLAQALILLPPLFPGDLVAYYNPWMGGLDAAVTTIPVGWGEGLDQMADYLAAKPDAPHLTVASWAVAGLAPRFPGRIVIPTEGNLPQADYVLLYIADVQTPSPLVHLFHDTQVPEHVVRVRDMPYAWLYPNRYVKELISLIGSTAGPGDAIALSLPSAFERVYAGPLPVRTITGASEQAVARELADLSEQMSPSGLHRVFFVDFDAATPIQTWIRRQLAQNGLFLWEQPFAFGMLRCYQLLDGASFRQIQDVVPSDARFGDQLELQGYGLASSSVQYRQEMGIALRFTALGPVSEDFHAFLHLLDDQGNRWAQRDGPLVDEASRRSSDWTPGSEHLCHFGVPLRPGIVPGSYRLVMGLYRLEDVARLPIVQQGSGAQTAELELALIEVASALVPPSIADLEIPHPLDARLADGIELLGHDLESATFATGDELRWTLWWRCLAPPEEEYLLEVVLSQGENVLATQRFAPTGPAYTTEAWQPGEILRYVYRYPIPLELRNGRYDVSAQLIGGSGTLGPAGPRIILTEIELLSPERVLAPPDVPTSLSAQIGDAIELVGYDLAYDAAGDGAVPPGQSLELTLFWHALEQPQQAYTVFVHLLTPAGVIHSQVDSEPQNGRRPTRGWVRGEYIIDHYELPLQADAPAGAYRIAVGMYDAATGVRLPVADSTGAWVDDGRILLPDAIEVATP